MTADLACAGPAFVDMTLAGLEAIPAPGEERHARDLVRTPGGVAITARGAVRLRLEAVLVSPIGNDADGTFLRTELARAGVRWAGREAARTAVTVVMPTAGERAMATYDPMEDVGAHELAAVDAAGVVIGLDHVSLAPAGARVYATVGHAEARAGAIPKALGRARSLILNSREAQLLTGRDDPEAAALALAERTPCAVVTCGADGAVAAAGGRIVRAPGVPAHAVDTTGAGDLFVAAYAWADLMELPLEDRLRWAVLYAALSVGVVSGWAGAASLDDLLRLGEEHGLAPPARSASRSSTRRKP